MNILPRIAELLESGERLMLATILRTTGSTPAAALSKMVVSGNGVIAGGTIGGGCVEGDVILHAQRLYETGGAKVITFHLNDDEAGQGLICGGSIDVLIETITESDLALIQSMATLADDGDDGVLVRWLSEEGGTVDRYLIRMGSIPELLETLHTIPSNISSRIPELRSIAERVYRKQAAERIQPDGGELICEPVTGHPSLLIFGGGHVSKYISRFASTVGFRVTVVDDREKFANPQRFPEAVATFAGDFLDVFNRLVIKKSTYVAIVTRGHRYDEEILGRVIQTAARYIGMIGSRRKIMTAYEHLIARGIAGEQLRRVYAPIGLEIGALSAEEIALSAVAELISIRRSGPALSPHKSDETRYLLHHLYKSPTIAEHEK